MQEVISKPLLNYGLVDKFIIFALKTLFDMKLEGMLLIGIHPLQFFHRECKRIYSLDSFLEVFIVSYLSL